MIWSMDGQSRVSVGFVSAEMMKQIGRVEHHGEFVSVSWSEKSKRYMIRRDLKSARELAGAIAEDCKGLAL